MKKRLLAFLLPLALLLSVGVQAAVGVSPDEDGALLPRSRAYEGQFADVSSESWYFPYAVAGYEYGLFSGRDDGFAPGADITVAELLALSARLHAAYEGDTIPAAGADEAWFAPYVAYLGARELLVPGLDTFDANATRAQLAAIFALSLPEDCYNAPNEPLVTEAFASGQYIADVDESSPYQPQILWMYRQGLLSGVDDAGSYRPDESTTRAETAAVVMRMVVPSLRITLDWKVIPAWSAAGTTYASLVEPPEGEVSIAPDLRDEVALDRLVRRMLSSGYNWIELEYPYALTGPEAQDIVDAFAPAVKRYCEQMYNLVGCQYYRGTGVAMLTFSATSCTADELARYRDETMARAIEVHDELWESGQITADMSQYDVAKVYYKWLCDNCAYDHRRTGNDSNSHIAYSALMEGKSVCDGYTGAYNLFLKMEGIDCYAVSNNTHIWTVATLDGTEYHIDVTWGDQVSYVDWGYFGMSAARSRQVHAE